jgi:type I restriction enzyme M protein
VENERAWKVSIEQIKATNFNLDQKNPHAAEVVSHDPDDLLDQYRLLKAEAQGLRDQIKKTLSEALVR